MRKYFSIILLVFVELVYAQNSPSFISIQPKTGILLAHRPVMHHLVQKKTYGLEINYSKQLTGDSDYTKRFKNPRVGVSFAVRDFGNDAVLGNALNLSPFICFPVYSIKNIVFDFGIESGLGYVTKKYHEFENPTNNAIGSHFNAYVNFKFTTTQYFDQFHYGLGFEFSHFSNGAVKHPNLGLNSPTLMLSAGYNFMKRDFTAGKKVKTKWEGNPFSFYTAFIFSGSEVPAVPNPAKLYPVFASQFLVAYRQSISWSWEGGVELGYNSSNLYRYPDSSFTKKDVPQLGFYLGGNIHFFKAEIFMGMGIYAIDKINPLGRSYNRIGYRYLITKHIYSSFSIKANFGRADYFEFGIGYKFH